MRIDFAKVFLVALCMTPMVLCHPSTAVPREKTYTVQNAEVVDILALVFTAEEKTNGWTRDIFACFSVNELDPSPKLVKSLRLRKLRVRSSGEWAKKFNCGFELQLELPEVNIDNRTKVRAKVVDLRDINTGQAHIAVLVRDGEYLLDKVDSKWSITGYVPLDVYGPAAAPQSKPRNL